MTKPLDLTRLQIKALCEGAKGTGYAPVVQIGNAFVRLIPEEHALPPQADSPVANGRKGYL
ncbi:hypothetical protein QBK99_23335 [Corticibacterium sp. UT-5YL-CI-8]|nr:hypothetical protein [Tianweitania sp. UT-5YL-CI-8]